MTTCSPCTRTYTVPKLVLSSLLVFIVFLANGQVVADFTIDDTTGCSFPSNYTIEVTNTGSSGAGFAHEWWFDAAGPFTGETQTYSNFVSTGTHAIKLVVTNTSNQEKDSLTRTVEVFSTPLANLTIDDANACVNGYVNFSSNNQYRDSAYWIMGDGTVINNIDRYQSYSYKANGTYNMQYITFNKECSDTSDIQPIVVEGPVADFSFSPEAVCMGDPVEFTMNPITDVNTFSWNLGEGDTQTVNPATHVYDTMGQMPVSLTVTGVSGSCTILDTLRIYEVVANFEFPAVRCPQEDLFFINTSTGNDNSYWSFGNGATSSVTSPAQSFNAGTYNVQLIIENNAGCADTLEQQLIVNDIPSINLEDRLVVCPGDPVQLQVTGGDIVRWRPSEGLDNVSIYNPVASPVDDTTKYSATVTDTLTQCSSADTITIILQPGFIMGKISALLADSAIIIGDTVQLAIFDTLARNLSYTWTPDTWISCTNCASPVVQPLESTMYTLVVSDTNQCFASESFEFVIDVTEEYIIGIPKAFTPNGDNINETIKVNGWGIKNLLEFRIYNRWGNEVFFTDDINTGWDGTYNDKPQTTGTYVYLVKAEMWDDSEKTQQGTFSLLR